MHVVYAYLQEPNEFFVMTNLWQTCNQTQGLCAEVSHSITDFITTSAHM